MPPIALVIKILLRFFGPSANSLKGYLNLPELLKIAITVFATGGGGAAVLPALLANVGLFVAAPYAGLATAILTLAVEVQRRLNQGSNAAALLSRRPASSIAQPPKGML